MATDFPIPACTKSCFVVLGPRTTDEGTGSFSLMIGDDMHRFETPAFLVPGTGIYIRLKVVRQMNTTTGGMGIQFLLVVPENDVIQIRINGHYAILTNGPGSFVYSVCNGTSNATVSYKGRDHPSLVLLFKFTDCPVSKIPDDVKNNVAVREKNVKLVVGGKGIPVSKELLISKSEVFRAMFEHDTKERQTGIVNITDFSFDIVEQMARFVMYGNCTLWGTMYDELAAIADKYNIIGMMELADKKKQLLDQVF